MCLVAKGTSCIVVWNNSMLHVLTARVTLTLMQSWTLGLGRKFGPMVWPLTTGVFKFNVWYRAGYRTSVTVSTLAYLAIWANTVFTLLFTQWSIDVCKQIQTMLPKHSKRSLFTYNLLCGHSALLKLTAQAKVGVANWKVAIGYDGRWLVLKKLANHPYDSDLNPTLYSCTCTSQNRLESSLGRFMLMP